MMDEQLYPKIQGGTATQAQVQSSDSESRGMLNFMEDKVKLLQNVTKKTKHITRKIKSKWSVANTTLKTCGISLASLLAAASSRNMGILGTKSLPMTPFQGNECTQ